MPVRGARYVTRDVAIPGAHVKPAVCTHATLSPRVLLATRHAFDAAVKRQRNPDKSTRNGTGRGGGTGKPVNRGKKEEEEEQEEVEDEDEDEDDNGGGDDDDDEDGGRPVAEGVDIHAGTRGRRTRPARTYTHSKM